MTASTTCSGSFIRYTQESYNTTTSSHSIKLTRLASVSKLDGDTAMTMGYSTGSNSLVFENFEMFIRRRLPNLPSVIDMSLVES